MSASNLQIAEKAGVILRQLVSDIQKTAELVQEISASCNEQHTGAGHINKAVQQLDLVIQQNAQAAEELSATAEELSFIANDTANIQTRKLQDAIAFFKIKNPDSVSEEHAGNEIFRINKDKLKDMPFEKIRMLLEETFLELSGSMSKEKQMKSESDLDDHELSDKSEGRQIKMDGTSKEKDENSDSEFEEY
ncbi:MAG: hypothetical protein B6245_07485 [Desulfobacteraceae bacterium 4572_88]|nr:MAG: hypothetical protein B6245_07485 [Desulfobacteraceae bacterium 4572_88]